MRTPLRHPALAAVLLAPVLVAGCEKPAPGVTVWSGMSSDHQEAACWQPARDQVLGPTQCAQDVTDAAEAGVNVPELTVAPGAVVGISVDPEVAKNGWTVQVAGQQLAQGLRDTYFRFNFPQITTGEADYTLQILASAAPTGTRGLWFFKLKQR